MTKRINSILFFISLFLFSYTLLRACLLSITWDEAYSYLEFARNGIVLPEKYEHMSANNHLLNTLLDIVLLKCFGLSDLVLRLPSLAAHLLFLYFSYKLVKDIGSSWLVVFSFIIINVNPYLLDFFSLSRGYALSLALMLASIYFIQQFILREKRKDAILVCVFAVFATLANFVILNYFIVVFGLLMLLMLKDRNAGKFIRAAIIPILVFAGALCFIVPIAMKLKEADALFYGGDRGFWSDTFSTITDRCFYELGYNYWFQRMAKGFVILVTLAAGALTIRRIIKQHAGKENTFLFALFFLLCFCSLSTIVQHYTLGTLFLIDRTALFLVVIFSLLLVFFVAEAAKEKKRLALISYLCAAAAIVHFVLAFNLSYVLEWKWDADIKQMITDLEKIKKVPGYKSSVSIGIPLEMDQGINYYRAKDGLDWINTVERSDLSDKRFDYLFFGPEEARTLDMERIEILKHYPRTNNMLARPKNPATMSNLAYRDAFDFGAKGFLIPDSLEYGPTFSYRVNDSITAGRVAEVEFSALVSSADCKANNLYMVISFENKEGLYLWKRAYVKDFIRKESEWVSAHFSVLVPAQTMAGDELKVYIWNPNRHQLLVKKMELKWLSAK